MRSAGRRATTSCAERQPPAPPLPRQQPPTMARPEPACASAPYVPHAGHAGSPGRLHVLRTCRAIGQAHLIQRSEQRDTRLRAVCARRLLGPQRRMPERRALLGYAGTAPQRRMPERRALLGCAGTAPQRRMPERRALLGCTGTAPQRRMPERRALLGCAGTAPQQRRAVRRGTQRGEAVRQQSGRRGVQRVARRSEWRRAQNGQMRSERRDALESGEAFRAERHSERRGIHGMLRFRAARHSDAAEAAQSAPVQTSELVSWTLEAFR